MVRDWFLYCMVDGLMMMLACRISVFANCQKDTVCVDDVYVCVVHALLPMIVFKVPRVGKNPVPTSPKEARVPVGAYTSIV